MSRALKAFVIIAIAVNACGFITWVLLWERIHAAPRQPSVETQQIVPFEYKGTTRFISTLDQEILQWNSSPWPMALVFSELAVFVWLWRPKPPVRERPQ